MDGFDLPMRVDKSGSPGEASHGRDGNSYAGIGRGATTLEGSVDTVEEFSTATTALDEDDPISPPTITTKEDEHEEDSGHEAHDHPH